MRLHDRHVSILCIANESSARRNFESILLMVTSLTKTRNRLCPRAFFMKTEPHP